MVLLERTGVNLGLLEYFYITVFLIHVSNFMKLQYVHPFNGKTWIHIRTYERWMLFNKRQTKNGKKVNYDTNKWLLFVKLWRLI